jgi:dTDP-4-amino-4,6-dideoxygalactose transaminase
MNIDLASVQASLTSRTAGVIAVHLYGNPAELDGLRQLCDRHGLFLIEDCAQAHGGTYRGQHVGNVGDIATFSFYPGKNLGALGDGGAITVNDATLARRAKMIANHGRSSKYDHEFEGRNSRLDSMQAAILSVKLPHLDRWVARRREVAAAYTDLLSESNVLSPPSNPDGEHAYHLYVVRSAARSQLMTSLSERRIETVVHYPIALPDLGAYSSHRQHGEKFYASVAADQVLSLPMGPHLSDEDVAEVAEWVLALSADSIPVA